LRAGDRGKIVIGKVLARRLDVELEDDLQITMAGVEEIQSAMLEIVGILKTGSRDLDASVCHVTLEDIGRISELAGPGEVSILLEDADDIELTQERLAERLTAGNEVITWKEVNPGIAANVEGDRAFMRVLAGIVLIVVVFGIASARLTAVLERRREFAMLSALGMKGRQLVGLLTLEALTVGLAGAAVALMLGGPAAYYLATRGVSMEAVVGEDFSFGDVLIDPYMYADFGIWLIWYALATSLAATILASIYPAWFAVKTDPADALRVV
jgi:ABC-type lipoprotein release transport system permease subunit